MSIEIYCYRGAGNKEMNSIEDSMITDIQMAKRRAAYEIDRQWYLVHSMDIETPIRPRDSGSPLNGGDIISIKETHLGISGKRKIRSISLSGSPTEMSMNLQLEKFEEFI